jgi:hypothetical protein
MEVRCRSGRRRGRRGVTRGDGRDAPVFGTLAARRRWRARCSGLARSRSAVGGPRPHRAASFQARPAGGARGPASRRRDGGLLVARRAGSASRRGSAAASPRRSPGRPCRRRGQSASGARRMDRRPRRPAPAQPVDDATRERLRALGYMD